MRIQSQLATLTRLGFAARGMVYILVGYAAFKAAQGTGKTQGSGEAIKELGQITGGPVLLVIVALGLIGYAAWRLVNAYMGSGDKEGGEDGPVHRVAHAISGLLHLALAFTAIRLAIGMGGGASDDQQARGAAAGAMGVPGGETLVVVVGIAVIAMGLGQLAEAVRADFMRHIGASGRARQVIEWTGRAGHLARGLVFAFAGYLLIQAGRESNPDGASGMSGVLERILGVPGGDTLLLLISVGLVLFGLFSFVMARYRRVSIPDPRRY